MIETGAMTAFKVIFQIIASLTILLAAWKLWSYIKFQDGLKPTPPQICLILEILGSIVRIIYMVDPFWSSGIYSNSASFGILSLTFTFTCITTLFLGLHWEKSLSALSKSGIGNIKKPLIVGTIIIILASILNVIGSVYISAFYFFIFYEIILVPAVLIFFLYCGIRILLFLRKNSSIRTSQKSSLQRVFIFISIIFIFERRIFYKLY